MPDTMLSRMQKVEILKQIAKSPTIPSPPTVILRVLEKASAPDCTIAELCKIIQMDPGLSGRILRIVNSALYGLSRPASSIQRALSIVGVNAARLLVLAIALPEMNRKSRLDEQSAQRYWRSSISAAIVAYELSQRFQAREAEDDMAAGLLCDIGELVLQQLFPNVAQAIAQQSNEVLFHSQCELEEVHCGLDHAEVSAFILDRWRLPSHITQAIRWHHHPAQGEYATPQAESRAYLLNFATLATQLVLDPTCPFVLHELYQLARERFQMSEEDVVEFLRPLGQKTADFAALLQVDMGEAGDFLAAVGRASDELIRLSLSANLDSQRALELSQRAESEAQHWRQEAVFDPLTKIFNRRFLDRKLQEFFDPARRNLLHFGLLFIDLDGFKPLNDRFGHAFGDATLQRVAEALQQLLRHGDIAARLGGDEFCVLTEPIDKVGLLSLGRRVLDAISNLAIRHGANEGRVGASIGAVCCNPSSEWTAPDEFLAGADRAMYLAKSRGRHQVVFLNSLTGVSESSAPSTSKSLSASSLPTGYSS